MPINKPERMPGEYHIPALVHVTEATQPLGHSTSGSQERYKTPERLAWEIEFDCLSRFRSWIIAEGMASDAADGSMAGRRYADC